MSHMGVPYVRSEFIKAGENPYKLLFVYILTLCAIKSFKCKILDTYLLIQRSEFAISDFVMKKKFNNDN